MSLLAFRLYLALWLDRHRLPATLALWLAFLLALSLIGLVVHRADAADLSVAWSLPTQNTDGSAIPTTGDGALTATRVEWGSCSGSAFGTKAGEVTVALPATSARLTGIEPGTWCVRAFARNGYGAESAASNVASRTIAAPVPKPPALVTVSQVAYEVLPHPIEGTRLGRNVGTVLLGTACGEEPVVGPDYFEVPRDTVTLTRTPKSGVVVARCEAAI